MDGDELTTEDDETSANMDVASRQQHRSRLACNFSLLRQLSQQQTTPSTDQQPSASHATGRPRPILGRGVNVSDKNDNPDCRGTNKKTDKETHWQLTDQKEEQLHEGLFNENRSFVKLPLVSQPSFETSSLCESTFDFPIADGDTSFRCTDSFVSSGLDLTSDVWKPGGSPGQSRSDKTHQLPYAPQIKEHERDNCIGNNSKCVGWRGRDCSVSECQPDCNEPSDYSLKEQHDNNNPSGWTGMQSLFPNIWGSPFTTERSVSDLSLNLNEVAPPETDMTGKAELASTETNLDVHFAKSEQVDNSGNKTGKGMIRNNNTSVVEGKSSLLKRDPGEPISKLEHAGNNYIPTGEITTQHTCGTAVENESSLKERGSDVNVSNCEDADSSTSFNNEMMDITESNKTIDETVSICKDTDKSSNGFSNEVLSSEMANESESRSISRLEITKRNTNIDENVSICEDADSHNSFSSGIKSSEMLNNFNSKSITGLKTTPRENIVDEEYNPIQIKSEDEDSTNNSSNSLDSSGVSSITNSSVNDTATMISLTERLGDLGIDCPTDSQVESTNVFETPLRKQDPHFVQSESNLESGGFETRSSNDRSLSPGVALSHKNGSSKKMSPEQLEQIDKLIHANMSELSDYQKQRPTPRKILSIENDAGNNNIVLDVANLSPSLSDSSDTSFHFENFIPRGNQSVAQEENISGAQSNKDGLTKNRQLPECSSEQESFDYSAMQAANFSPSSEPDIADLYCSVSSLQSQDHPKQQENKWDNETNSVLNENVEMDGNLEAETSEHSCFTKSSAGNANSVNLMESLTLDAESMTSDQERIFTSGTSHGKLVEVDMERGKPNEKETMIGGTDNKTMEVKVKSRKSNEDTMLMMVRSDGKNMDSNVESTKSDKEKLLWESLLSKRKAHHDPVKTALQLPKTPESPEGHLDGKLSNVIPDTGVVERNVETRSSEFSSASIYQPKETAAPGCLNPSEMEFEENQTDINTNFYHLVNKVTDPTTDADPTAGTKESEGNKMKWNSNSSEFVHARHSALVDSRYNQTKVKQERLPSGQPDSDHSQQLVESVNAGSLSLEREGDDDNSGMNQHLMLELPDDDDPGDFTSSNTSTALVVSNNKSIFPVNVTMREAQNSKMTVNMIVSDQGRGHISNNIIDQTVLELCHEMELFSNTSCYETAKQVLEEEGVIFLVGTPGSGKTLMARRLARAVSISDADSEWISLSLKFPQEWRDHAKPDQCQVILMEDIFGYNEFDTKSFFKWKRLKMESMQNIKTKRLIFTLRMHVLNEALPHFQNFALFKSTRVIDVVRDLDEGKLSLVEKNSMLTKHMEYYKLNSKIGTDIVKAIITSESLSNFPSCCKYFCKTKRLHNAENAVCFFNNPVEYFVRELRELYNEKDKTKFAALLLTVVMSGELDIRLLDDNNQSDCLDEMRQYLTTVGISSSVTFVTIKQSTEHFLGTYLAKKNNNLVFAHPSIYDAACLVYGRNHSKYLLRVCTVSFLHQYVSVSDIPMVTLLNLSLKPTDPGLAERFIKEIKDEHPIHVCRHQALTNEAFVSQFIKACEQSSELGVLTSVPTNGLMPLLYWAVWSKDCLFFKAILLQYMKQKRKIEKIIVSSIANGCCITGNYKVLELIDRCLKVDLLNMTSLVTPVPFESIQASRALDGNADMESDYTAHGGKLIHVACFHGNNEIVKFLLTKAVASSNTQYVNSKDEFGRTPCHIVAKCGHMNILRTLLSHKCNLLLHSKAGNLSIHDGCSSGHTDIVEMILKKHPHLLFEKSSDQSSRTPLHFAVVSTVVPLVKLLMNLESRQHVVRDGSSLIHLACTRPGNSHVLRELCQRLQNSRDREDYFLRISPKMNTPLHVVCERTADEEMAQVLIDFGVDVDVTNVKHRTALHLACANVQCTVPLVEMLLKNGVNPSVRDLEGRTALDVARNAEVKQYVQDLTPV